MSGSKLVAFVCILFIFSSCAFDKKFHHPIRIPNSIETLTQFKYSKDTILFKYNKETEEIKLLGQNGKIITDNYKIENTNFPSSSKNKLNGWLITPKGQKPVATILHFHGSAGDLLSQYESITPLIEYGFQIFTFDYSGYGFSEGKSTRKNALKDAYSALEFARKHQDIKDTKLILYGQSYGGYLASVISATRQDDINGIVIEGAFSSHREEAKYEVPFWGNLVKNGKIAEKEIQQNYKPVLIIHSSEDKKVPFEFGERIFKNANTPKEFYEIDKPHILGLQYYPEEISSKIKAMMRIE